MPQFVGTPTLRKEDPALLSGRGRYADDLPAPAGTLHAHVIRSNQAHAEIARIDTAAALAAPGVWAVITGEDVKKLSDPFLIALKAPVHQWSLAVGRVRYVGEPVAVVVAENRYLAEDAADLVRVEYSALPVVMDPLKAREKSAALLHPDAKTTKSRCANFPTATPRAPSKKPTGSSSSPQNIRGSLIRRWNAMSWSRNMIRPKTATTCWRISRARSAPIR